MRKNNKNHDSSSEEDDHASELAYLRRQYKDLLKKRSHMMLYDKSLFIYWDKIIKNLESEKANTLKELGLATSSTCSVRDNYNCKKLENTLLEKSKTIGKINRLVKENSKLDAEIKKWEEKVQLQRIESAKLKHTMEKNCSTADTNLKRMAVLEGRLNREENKCNSILAKNRNIRELIETLVNEKHKFEHSNKSLKHRFQHLKAQTSSILDLALVNLDQITDINNKQKLQIEKFKE